MGAGFNFYLHPDVSRQNDEGVETNGNNGHIVPAHDNLLGHEG